MPIYVMLTSLTDEGRKTIKQNPQRIKEVNKEVHDHGSNDSGRFYCQHEIAREPYAYLVPPAQY
jgi:uncharacterized protein with GYD domain